MLCSKCQPELMVSRRGSRFSQQSERDQSVATLQA